MIASVALGGSHQVVLFLPGAQRRITHRITQTLRTTGRGKAHIVVSVALVEPRTLLIVLHRPGGFLAERHSEVDLRTLLLHGTHHTVLGIEHVDIALC